jgi:serine phosphatase RsbU (regulator of sigma subunit)
MSLRETLDRIVHRRSVKDRLAYFRSIPLSKLTILAAAAFLVCAAAGLVAVLSDTTLAHPAVGLCFAAVWGFCAALGVIVIARRPKWLPAVGIFEFLLIFAVTRLSLWIKGVEAPAPFASIVYLYSALSLVLMMAGYALFAWFIQTEGRFAFRAQTELALAHGIQQTLVPVIDVSIAGCEIYGISVPSEKVGGDLVDVVPLPGGGAVAYLADIAGHGLNAGILMGMLKAATRATLLEATGPEVLFENLNRVLPGVKEAYMYATCVAFRVQSRPGGGCDVQFSLAGHPPVLHLSGVGEARPRLTDEQFPLGLLAWTGYRSQAVFAEPGDLLIAVTDGVLEVAGKDGVEFGMDGLEQIVAIDTAMPLPLLAQKILGAVKARGPQLDDQTLLLIRVL